MTEEKFKLPNSSYEELVKIVKGYGRVEEPSSLTSVSQLTALDSTIISRNAGFLVGAEILEPGSKKKTTSKGKKLAQALEHELPENIRVAWREIIEESEFLSKIITAIEIRNGMDQSTLESHIAYSAGQPKKPQFMTGARTIIDILRAAEIIKEVDGKIVVTDGSIVGDKLEVTQIEQKKEDTSNSFKVLTRQINSSVPCQVTIELRIECKPNEIEGLGTKLRVLIEEFSKPPDGNVEEKNTEL
jgi:hypothetical protein